MRDSWRIFASPRLVVACSPSSDVRLARDAHQELAGELARYADDMLAAVRARDRARVVTFYDPVGGFVHYDNRREVSWEVLSPQVRRFLLAAARINLAWAGSPHVVVLGPDAALVRRIQSLEGLPSNGNRLLRCTGTWTGVVRRIGGQWKLIERRS